MINPPLLHLQQLPSYRIRHRGEKIVFTAGSFDLLHLGHARYLAKAKTFGDLLVVGVPSDKSLRQLKGEGRPLIGQHARALAVAALEEVDAVVIFPQPTVLQALQELRPDVFFTVDEGWNKNLKESPEYKFVQSYGGKIVLSARQSPFLSASALIRKVAGVAVKEIFKECLEAAEKEGPFSEDPKKAQLPLGV